MEQTIIKSRRKTYALQVCDGILCIRVPFYATDREIAEVLEKNRGWIEKQEKAAEDRERRREAIPCLTPEELRRLGQEAAVRIPERVRYYAPRVGVTYGRITIRAQRTRWGSCSSKGNLNFNCLLLLAPPEVLDSVVVHELCHRRFMNHSEDFYREVRRVLPDYAQYHQWLRKHGAELMDRLPE